MRTHVRAAVIGDVHPGVQGYGAICEALKHSAHQLSIDVEPQWIPTRLLTTDAGRDLANLDAVWCGPWGPYDNSCAAMHIINTARVTGKPFLGTCAGFQHAVIEYARAVLGHVDADHEESNPHGRPSVITRLAEPLLERTGVVALDPASRTARMYRRTVSAERYRCEFGLNPMYVAPLHAAGLRVCGVNEAGVAVAVELPDHPFFVATLFLPERTTRAGAPHPLITAWLRTAAEISGVRPHPDQNYLRESVPRWRD